jgi:hypothetical protein
VCCGYCVFFLQQLSCVSCLYRCFDGIYRLHLQGLVSRARYQRESSCRRRCMVISTPWSLYFRGKGSGVHLVMKMGGGTKNLSECFCLCRQSNPDSSFIQPET